MRASTDPSRRAGGTPACSPRRFAGRRGRTILMAAAVAMLLPLGGLALLVPGAARAQAQQPVQPQTPQAPQAPQTQTPQAPGAPANAAAAGQVHGDWVQRCTAEPPAEASPPPPGEEEVCFLIQQVMDQDTRRPLLKITVGFFGPDREPRAIIAMPLGVPLTHDLKISVDGREVGTVPFDICRPDGCLANILMDDSVVGAFKAGGQAQARVESNQGRTVNLPISLKGFTAGFTAIQ